MKNKIIIFICAILTFGLFLIPITFAKSINPSTLYNVNRINNYTLTGSNAKYYLIDVNYSDLIDNSNNGKYWKVSVQLFDDNLNMITSNSLISSVTFRYYNGTSWSSSSLTWRSTGNEYYYYLNSSLNGNYTQIQFYVNLSSQSNITAVGNYKYNVMISRDSSSSTTTNLPLSNAFITNIYYSPGLFSQYGFFEGVSTYLVYEGVQGQQDVTATMVTFNNIAFNSLASSVASNNNINTNQYIYLRVYFNCYVSQMANLQVSYLEFNGGMFNNSNYDKNGARNLLPILSSNMVLYNDNTTLFSTSDLVNSGYGNIYINYIEFVLPNYTFKSSSYYNSTIGMEGYIKGVRISALSVSNLNSYNAGYLDGKDEGYNDGYRNGYSEGSASSGGTFDNLFFAIANVPMGIISSMLNFEILGFNLLGFFMGIITLLLFVNLIRKFKE